MFRALRVNLSGLRKRFLRQYARSGYRVPLVFGDFPLPADRNGPRNSTGVCARNCARDITWAEDCILAFRICSESFLWDSVFGIGVQGNGSLMFRLGDFHPEKCGCCFLIIPLLRFRPA